jgi:quercetin dioxygenase-like cupin family protein
MERAPRATVETTTSSGCPPRHPRDLRTTRGPGLRTLTRPVLKFDLAEEAEALRSEAGWRHTGHSAKTLAKHRDVTIVLIAMKRDTRMKEHRADGAVSIQVLTGQLRFHIGTRSIDTSMGDLLVLDRAVSHDVEALDDSAFVLSVCASRSRGRSTVPARPHGQRPPQAIHEHRGPVHRRCRIRARFRGCSRTGDRARRASACPGARHPLRGRPRTRSCSSARDRSSDARDRP